MAEEKQDFAASLDLLVPEGELEATLESLGGKKVRYRRVYMQDFALISKAQGGDVNKMAYAIVAHALLEPRILPHEAGRLKPKVLEELSNIIMTESGLSEEFQEEAKNSLEPTSGD